MKEGSWLPVPTGPPLTKRAAWDGWLLSPMAVIGGAMVLMSPFVAEDLQAVYWIPGATGLALYAWATRAERRLNELAIRPEESAMLYELGVPEAVLVSMWVLQGRAVTGHDRGAVWIEEGRLLFCGKRTSFVLTRADVDGGIRSPREGPGKTELRLRRETPAGPMAVAFTTLIGDRPFVKPLNLTLALWLDEAPPAEPGQWPPATLGPDTPKPGEIRRKATRRGLVPIGFFGLLAFPVACALGFLPLLAGMLALGLAFLYFSVRQRPEIRDRQRLEAP